MRATSVAKWVGAVVAALGLAVGAQGRLGLCDYRPPTTDLRLGTVSFFYEHVEDPSTPGLDTSAGNLTLNLGGLYDAPELGYNLGGTGRFTLRNLGLVQTLAEASGGLRRYLVTGTPYFTFGGFEFRVDTAKRQPGLLVQAGLGYGRFHDVTPLAKALRIDKYLLALGILPVALSDQTVLAIAKEIERKEEYPTVADQVAAIAKLIEAEARRRLDLRTVLSIEKVVTETVQQRYCGWILQVGMAYELLDPMRGPTDFLLSLAFDGALAPEPDSQLLLKVRVSGPYWILEQHTLEFDASYDYRLNEEVTFAAQYRLRQDKPRDQAPAGTQSATFDLRFNLARVGVTLQVAFYKVAEMPTWTQRILLSLTANLW